MTQKTCEICKKIFNVRPYREKTARFCSRNCKSSWIGQMPWNFLPKAYMIGNKYRVGIKPTNSFQNGNEPWNKNMKGIHLSPKSEFNSDPRPEKRADFGKIVTRVCRNGILRNFIKLEHPKWKMNSRHVWESVYGPIPKGMIIHHKDRNTLNDSIENLDCLTRAEHIEEHRHEICSYK